ncbi:hypothetical protein RR48_05707 [Papilio machaon]|uniref:Myb/SANT-like DNA-binding domain-containing protein n=1 Tax=Papilio machaon TaxID=76193 RepID=A0A0N1I5L0_PAPMA|nr:hypothetical protein RR48_05707 [Papilio machaon]
MSESRKNHLIIEGNQGREADHGASYKPIPETDTATDVEYIDADREYMQLNKREIMEGEIVEDGDDHWDHNSIRIMLNLYIENLDKFRNPKIRKKNLWSDVANAVGKSPDCCNKKFRNLKQTYIRLLKKKNRIGMSTVKWPYFESFEEIYCVDGEYQPEIQQKLQESSNESIAKALLSISSPSKFEDSHENGETSSGQNEEVRRRLTRKRNAEFRKVTLEIKDRQRLVEEKLDRLINIVEESNNIQRERNKLFEEFLEKLRDSQGGC